MKQTVTPVVGLPEFRGWSQVVTNDDRSLVCALAVEGVDAGSVGTEITTHLQSAQLSSAAELHQFLEEILDLVEQKGVELSLAATLLLDEKLILAGYQAMVVLKKEAKVGTLFRAGQDLQVVSGNLREKDVIVLLTQPASSFAEEISQKLTKGFDVDTIVTSLVPGVHADQNTARIAIGFILLESLPSELVEPETDFDFDQDSASDEDYEDDSLTNELDIPDLNVSDPESDPLKDKKQFEPSTNKRPKTFWFARPDLSKIRLFFARVRNLRPQVRLPFGQEVYVGHDLKKKRLIRRGVTGVVVFGVIAAFLGWQFYNISRQKSQAQELVDPLLAQVEEAKQQAQTDPIPARQKVESILQELTVLESKFETQSHALSYVKDKRGQVENYYQEISGREEFQELDTFFDLRLVESEFIATQADLAGQEAVFLDAEKKNIILLNLESKEYRLMRADNISAITDMVFSGQDIFILGQGLYRVGLDDKEPQEIKAEGDSNRAAEFIGYFGDYLYVFNPEERNIYRYAPSEDGYSDPIGWLTSKQGLDFNQINAMQIDGDIWLTTSDGQIKKFSTGQEQDFSVQGLQEEFSSPLSIFTKENFEYLYVLEPAKNRLVILTKDGKYLKEVQSQSLASTTKIIVNEDQKRAYAISGSLVFSVALD